MNLGSKPSLRARIGKARSKLHKSELSRLGGDRLKLNQVCSEANYLDPIQDNRVEYVKLDGMRLSGVEWHHEGCVIPPIQPRSSTKILRI